MNGADRSPLLAILWQRFGPYHRARLSAAAQALTEIGWCVRGVEVAGRDQYSWKPVDGGDQLTLFPDRDYEELSASAIRTAVERAFEELDPRAVAINGWSVPEALAALRWCRGHRRRKILMSESHQASSSWLKQLVKRWRVSRFDAALVGGRWHRAYLESLGFAPARIEIGYDAVDNAHFARPGTEGSLPEVWQRPYFFANTRFLERKGIDALLHAFARYRKVNTGPEAWHLVISGSGALESAWKTLAAELGIADWVRWPGFLQYDVLPAAYQRAGAFVHPARAEAWGLVVNEAAAAGLPLIVGQRVGAACELVRAGENGFLIDPDDLAGFARVLGKVAGLSDEERVQLGEASRRIVGEFGPERFGRGLVRCLQAGG